MSVPQKTLYTQLTLTQQRQAYDMFLLYLNTQFGYSPPSPESVVALSPEDVVRIATESLTALSNKQTLIGQYAEKGEDPVVDEWVRVFTKDWSTAIKTLDQQPPLATTQTRIDWQAVADDAHEDNIFDPLPPRTSSPANAPSDDSGSSTDLDIIEFEVTE